MSLSVIKSPQMFESLNMPHEICHLIKLQVFVTVRECSNKGQSPLTLAEDTSVRKGLNETMPQ